MKHQKFSTLLIAGTLALVSCSINPFNEGEVPVIDVRKGNSGEMVISWKPQGAWHVRVLEGEVDPKDPVNTRPPSKNVIWGIGEAERPVRSPVTVGVEQTGTETTGEPKELVAGRTYSVYVLRHDPKGSGDGFTNTRNTYEAVKIVAW